MEQHEVIALVCSVEYIVHHGARWCNEKCEGGRPRRRFRISDSVPRFIFVSIGQIHFSIQHIFRCRSYEYTGTCGMIAPAESPEQKTSTNDNETRPPGGVYATVNRVGDFVAERKAAKDKAFSHVLSRAGWILAGGTLWYIPVIALSVIEVLPAWMILYLEFPTYLSWAVSLILLSTLPLDTFDVDASVDSLPAVRRIATIGFFVIFSADAIAFPYIPGALGACVCLVKFVWEELDIGCCARSRQSTTTNAGVPSGVPSGRCGGGRPRISAIFCIYWAVLGSGLTRGTQCVFNAPCHAGAAALKSTDNTTNTTTASRMCSFG